ncbi:hypothetical protein QBC47DRAFT_191939 [Echria macrotheca]|uniref:NAD-dependent epimerase/dehydratase domain-containing protein n=1 Tax=Echria macrotheca TaxID=438768 RepID=A0AAJ0BD21_9PEZI|nr:hypothetical protein QBC47DRAFT_191939 [Echria macrotheca]
MTSPSEQTLLLTGANSYVGSHIIQQALEKGYHVRGVVRSESSTAGVRDKFSAHSDKLSFAVVPDITKPELFEPAFANPAKPITGVIHVASPFVLNVEDNKRDLLDPAIGGSLAIVKAASAYGKDVRRIVVTSSFAAILDVMQGTRVGYTYTEADWNPMDYETATGAPGGAAYCASKALAEKAMWDYVAAEKPQFDLVVLNPAWVFGPHVGGVKDTKHLNESSHMLYSIIGASEVPGFDFGGFVDVRTLGAAHLAAFEIPEAGGQRFLMGQHFDYQSVVDSLRSELPELKDKLPEGTPGKVPESYAVDGSKAEKVLGIKYIPLSESMKDSFVQFVEADKAVAASA